jgi:UPF0755 protein
VKKLTIFLLLLFIGVIAAAAAGLWAYGRLTEPYRGYAGAEQFVEVPAGSGSRAIGDRLVDAGVVRDPLTFRLALRLSGQGRRLQAGEYRFDQAMSPLEVIDKLSRGDVYLVSVTFPEGLTIPEMAKIFEERGFGQAQDFVAAAANPEPIVPLDPDAPNLEGYLFPETYPLPRRVPAAQLVQAMTDHFARVFTPELRQAAEAQGLSVREVVTLASLVEKEASRPEERPLVAAVYANRLRIGMALQCDPTVIYALQLEGRYTGNLRREDLAMDSPYNTYRYPGLPPGPIASPGHASIHAAVHPADVDYLYFVSRNDGSHEFARTLAEHNRNVQRWQIQYFRDLRANRARQQETGPDPR